MIRFNNTLFSKTLLVSTLAVISVVPQAVRADDISVDDIADDDVPASMGVLGDSISAGALAKYRRVQGNLPWVQGFVVGRLLGYYLTKNVRAIEFPGYSWAGGDASGEPVRSHVWRLKALNKTKKRKFLSHISAVSGYESTHVRDLEIPELNKWSQEKLGQEYPDYVTILIGANDICENSYEDMRSVGDYFENVSYAVDQMLEKSPKTKVLISSLPNITALRDVAKSSRLTGVGHLANKCEDFWRTAKLCPTLTMEGDPEKRAVIEQRVRDYNTALNDLADSRYKMHGDRVRFAPRPYEVKFTDTDISVDCFHPNPDGQNKLAEASWSSSWWAGIR